MGQFRCDTFLIHVYSVGDYYVLKSGATLPRNVFASFPNGNGDGPWAQNDKLQENTEKLASTNYSLDTLSLTDLNILGLEEFISVMNTLENVKEPHVEDKIWELYQNIEGTEKKTFLLDYLGGIGSPTILPQIIKDYSQNTNPEIKYALLASTQPIYSRSHLLQNNLSMKQQLISFYLNLLENDSTQPLPFKEAQVVATGLIDIASKEVILENIEKINSIFERAKPYEQIGYKCNLMLDIQSLESSYIPQIIDLLIKENDRQLDERFFSYIKDALSRKINNLSPKLKNLISNYLNSISYKFDNTQEGLSKSDNPASMFAFGAWIEASALVNSETLKDAGHYIAEFLKNKPTVDQVNYIIGLSHAAYLQKAFKTESVFMSFVEKNKNIKSAPVSKDTKTEND